MEEKNTDKQLKIMSAIARIHQVIGARLELEEISRLLVNELVGIVEKSTGCAILLIEGSKVKVLAEKGFLVSMGMQEFTTDMPALKFIIETGQNIFTGDIWSSPAANCIPSGCTMSSLICVPITANEEIKGIIHLDSVEKNAFDEEDLSFVERLAEEISFVAERSLVYSRIKEQSIRDALTGCFNRRKFDEDIDNEIERARRYARPLSLAIIDIDWFKDYNDYHGHLKGDVLLKKLAALLNCNARESDRVYRYGGEEFAVLLPETDKEEAFLVTGRLKEVIELKHFEGESESQPNRKVTVSIGLSSFRFPEDANTKETLLKAADSALYRAKESGKNRVCTSDRNAVG